MKRAGIIAGLWLSLLAVLTVGGIEADSLRISRDILWFSRPGQYTPPYVTRKRSLSWSGGVMRFTNTRSSDTQLGNGLMLGLFNGAVVVYGHNPGAKHLAGIWYDNYDDMLSSEIPQPIVTSIDVPIPYLLFAPLGSVLCFGRLWFLARRRARRARSGCCVQCGYDLRASPGRCPECGRAAVAA